MIRYQRVRIYVESIKPWVYEDKVHRLLNDTYDRHKVAGFIPAADDDPCVLIAWIRHPHKGQGQSGPQFKYKPLPEELILKGNKLEDMA